MNNSKTTESAGRRVIAIAQEENKLKAIELVSRGESYEFQWGRSGDILQSNIQEFASECGLTGTNVKAKGDRNECKSVLGYDSSAVVFHRLRIPAVKKTELESIIRHQAETRLPLPSAQMEFGWSSRFIRDGQIDVTLAAARTKKLQDFVENVGFEPEKILLNYEGIVKVWRKLFSGTDEPAVVLDIGLRNTKVCLADRGKLVNAANIDIGKDDFESAQQSGTIERFSQDLRSVLEFFGYSRDTDITVDILSNGGNLFEQIVSSLVSSGISARASLAEAGQLPSRYEVSSSELYEYRIPIGLAELAFEDEAEVLDIFEAVYRPVRKKERPRWYYSLKLSGSLAAAAVVLFLVVSYYVVTASDEHLTRLKAEANFSRLQERRELINNVVRERPDLFALLKRLNSVEGGGVKLDRFEFKKGSPVSIHGQASNAEQAYNFQENLHKEAGIKGDMVLEKKTDDKHGFTIKFHYKHFTRRESPFSSY